MMTHNPISQLANVGRLGRPGYAGRMDYSEEAEQRIRTWQTDDPTLYQETLGVLRSIAAEPQSFGQPGFPLEDRLFSYGVPGRTEQYCVVWNSSSDEATIIDLSTHDEFVQRMTYQQKHGLD